MNPRYFRLEYERLIDKSLLNMDFKEWVIDATRQAMGLCVTCGHEEHPLCNNGNCDVPHPDPQGRDYD